MNKKYLVALIVVILFATASVSANSAFKRITAIERPDYKLLVNNEVVELKNNPITINGVTYLPLREVATILDQDVNFEKGTITLKSTEVTYKEIGTTYNVSGTQIKLNSIGYKTSNKFNYPTDLYMVINFEISTPDSMKGVFVGFDFINYVSESGKKVNGGVEELSVQVLPGSKNTVEILIPVESQTSSKIISLRDPSTNKSIEYKVN